MTRGSFLISTWDGGGNVPPALALAARLAARGHRVRVVGPPWIGTAVADAGAALIPNRTVEPVPPDASHEANWPRVHAMLNGPAAIDDLRAELRADPADVLVADSLSGAALAVGEALGLPTAILCHTLYAPYREWGPHVANVRETRRAVGLSEVEPEQFGEQVLDRAAVVLALVPPGFDIPLETLPSNTRYIGPILQPNPPRPADIASLWHPTPGRPTVLVSFGTTVQRQREALGPVLDVIAELPVQGLLTLGGVLSPDDFVAPPNVDIRGHLPHSAVMPSVDVVVCHGGLSTIMAALAAGRPLVIIPQGRDQDTNAERVVASGAGIALPTDAAAPEIAAAIQRAIKDTGLHAAAERIAGQIAGLGAGAAATDLVEDLVPDRQRVHATRATATV